MTFGFRAEVGYDADKDFTFLRTNTSDFANQLHIPITRGSEEDIEIRALLEDQGLVDFTAVTKRETLPIVKYSEVFLTDYETTFGMVGLVKDESLTVKNFAQTVIFGEKDSGAINLIRFWLLSAIQNSYRVVAVGTPDDLYGSMPHMNSNITHLLNPNESLREQFETLDLVRYYNGAGFTIFIVGEDFEAESLEDRLFLKEMQNGAYRRRPPQDDLHEHMVMSLIHRSSLLEKEGDYFTGSDGGAENVTYVVIGDVNEATANLVANDIPTRNAPDIAWLSYKGAEPKRVKTYFVTQSMIEKGDCWK